MLCSIRPLFAALSVSVFLASGFQATVAHEGDDSDHDHPQPVVAAKLYRPTSAPDRICLSWTGDPATSMSVTWRTDTAVERAFAEVAVAEDGPDFEDGAKRVDATTQLLETDLGPAHYHQANFDGLRAETKYLYRVGDGVNWSEWAEFQTASDSEKPFSFVYFGDAQNDIKSHWSRVVRNAFRDAPRAAFFLHAGDLVNRAESDAEWGEWFYAGGFIHRTLPAVAVPGNHEMVRRPRLTDPLNRGLSKHWRSTFAFPENGPASLLESCYTIDYQGVRIVCLNSNEQQDVQAGWLKGVLSETDGWKIVTHHHPIYSASKGRDNPALRALWQPIYDRYDVDLVLQGHDHTYARSKLMQHGEVNLAGDDEEVRVGTVNVPEGKKVREQGGTVYVVSVSGPKMYELDRQPYLRSSTERTQLYQIITVDGDRLRYRARTATGRLYDAFDLVRRGGKPNRLVEVPVD